jgi:hypothetical protein
MTDSELRRVMLQKFYEARRQGYVQIPVDDTFDRETSFDIVRQLAEHGLLNWKPLIATDFRTAMAQITAEGIDVIEGNKPPPTSIAPISVIGSSNVQVGDRNIQGVSAETLNMAIEHSNITESERREAKSLLERFLGNPLITKIFGSS